MSRTAAILLLLLAPSFAALPFAGRSEEQPVRVTTDTADYCAQLDRAASERPDPPAEARDLIAAGQTMCAQGHVRGGIERLRRALMIIQRQGR